MSNNIIQKKHMERTQNDNVITKSAKKRSMLSKALNKSNQNHNTDINVDDTSANNNMSDQHTDTSDSNNSAFEYFENDLAFPLLSKNDNNIDAPFESISNINASNVTNIIDKNEHYTSYMKKCKVHIEKAAKVIDEQKKLEIALDNFEKLKKNSNLTSETELEGFVKNAQKMKANNEANLAINELIDLAQKNRSRYNDCKSFCESLKKYDDCLRDIDNYIKIFLRADEVLKGYTSQSSFQENENIV